MRKFSCQSWGDFMNFLLSVSFLRQVNNSEPSYWGRADTGRPRPRLAQDIFVYLGSGKIKEEVQREVVCVCGGGEADINSPEQKGKMRTSSSFRETCGLVEMQVFQALPCKLFSRLARKIPPK